ncbi:MAG: NAD(P)-dependent oxidoreductase, partial [Rhodospirillaceae bacterium]
MAGHLAKHGHTVRVYNRTASRAARWVEEYRGDSAPTPRQACAGVEIAFCCVGDDADVRSVVCGPDGMLAGLSAGSVIVDHTTASAALARELSAESAGLSVGFVDAPVSGGQAGAENGALTVMCGGELAHYEKVEGAISAFAKSCRLIGGSG